MSEHSGGSPFVSRLLEETREEISRADSKASIILAGSGVALGALLGGFVYGRLVLSGEPWPVIAGAFVALVLLVAGMVLLGVLIAPTTGSAAAGRARYYKDVAAYDDAQGLRRALEGEAADPLVRDAEQLLTLSRLVCGKYARMRQAMWLLAGGFGAAIVTASLSAFT
jgi:hypothetical protein